MGHASTNQTRHYKNQSHTVITMSSFISYFRLVLLQTTALLKHKHLNLTTITN